MPIHTNRFLATERALTHVPKKEPLGAVYICTVWRSALLQNYSIASNDNTFGSVVLNLVVDYKYLAPVQNTQIVVSASDIKVRWSKI